MPAADPDPGRALLPPSSATTKVVAIEGIDGAGKATQAQLLREALEASGQPTSVCSFPVYESFFGSTIRQLLDGKLPHSAETVDPRSMALWYALDRWEAFQPVRANDDPAASPTGAKAESAWLILNRFTLSNAVYQAARVEVAVSDGSEGSGPEEADRVFHWILDLEHRHLRLPLPDVTVILDVEPAVSQDRSDRRAQEAGGGATQDVYERSANLLAAARHRYLRAADELPNVVVVPCLDSAGRQRSPEAVHQEIMAAIASHQDTSQPGRDG